MSNAAETLPQLTADLFLTDGGIETTLIFEDGFELPDFAAFLLLDDPAGRAALEAYFERYAAIADRTGLGIVLETPTWRASVDWGARHGFDAAEVDRLNRDAVALVRSVQQRHAATIVVSGCIGPRGDGYRPTELMTAEEAATYHAVQAQAFSSAEADLITAITMTYPDEAIGIAQAARAAGLPVVISFTVETDGCLFRGESLEAAIADVDAATDSYPAYYMVNCAYPTHFAAALEPSQTWMGRLRGIRANASTMSHDELDEAEELDAGDPADLAERCAALRDALPQLNVLGGCCGTNQVHIEALAERCSRAAS